MATTKPSKLSRLGKLNRDIQPGWLPVVGGPCDGYEMYGVDHFAAGTKIKLATLPTSGELYRRLGFVSHPGVAIKLSGYYSLGLNRDRIEWVRG